MYFTDDSLLPENQEPLIICVAPYGPAWLPGDYPEDIPLSWEAQVQKALDCYNAGAVSRNKVAFTNNCSVMTIVFIPQVAEAIHQTINRTQQHPTSICTLGVNCSGEPSMARGDDRTA
jgi:hypothetical protein